MQGRLGSKVLRRPRQQGHESEAQASLGYIVRPSLKKERERKKSVVYSLMEFHKENILFTK
jgi:hypothetical protein